MKRRFALARILFACGLVFVLAACGGDSDDPTPTPVELTPTPGGIDIPTGERPDGDFSVLTQRLLIENCRVTVPLDWTSFGTGTGETSSRARFTINGGSIASDDAWEEAVQLVASQAMRQGVESLTRGDDWVYAVQSGNRGFTFRARFDNQFCDVAVQGTDAIPETERATWPAVIGSVEAEPLEP